MKIDYLYTEMPDNEINRISSLGLAHIGDAVYELMVRAWLCTRGKLTAQGLHSAAVRYVSAASQAKASEKIFSLLSDDEASVFKRGRNTKVNSVPKNSDISAYHLATALETLFGWLYLRGERDRLNELFGIIISDKRL